MSDDEHQEIIIVKRVAPEEDGHHGGVWKIAYADFMTAMMAFFLIMWLVNAANDQTKQAVASYFNPIKLTDRRPVARSIHDETSASEAGSATKAGRDEKAGAGKQEHASDAAKTGDGEKEFFDDPYAVLAEIADQTGDKANISQAGEGGASDSGAATGASGGTAYRDPFDPAYWVQQVASKPEKPAAETDVAPDRPEKKTGETSKARPADEDGKAGETGPVATDTKSPASGKGAAKESAAIEAKALQEQIEAATGGLAGTLAEGISVKPSEGGLLVSITDHVEDGMFNVGSAVPRHDMVVAMQKIGSVLAKRKGAVVIRGFTDARPYHGTDRDNWRLSTKRAESAYYMLVRGGLEKKRVEQISGFADRRPLLPDQPLAAANRRIEILIATGGDKS
ncbi:MotB family protein [Pararhizobium mangrovi]|uniref:MotB family protein n=1 Tax=Pararhizobium mangrovi TaxID=2590452 RepID=UPI001F2B086E|nr:MotB family protein [Pararhizobium mangrovi]